MDAVSRIVIERERSRPRLLPYALIALFFHSSIVGAIFLVLADLVARTLRPPAEIPIGIITAAAGISLLVSVLMLVLDLRGVFSVMALWEYCKDRRLSLSI